MKILALTLVGIFLSELYVAHSLSSMSPPNTTYLRELDMSWLGSHRKGALIRKKCTRVEMRTPHSHFQWGTTMEDMD